KMLIKKFVGTSVPETMNKIKKELGAFALILDTKVAAKGDPYGLPNGNRVEITAAIDHNPRKPVPIKMERKVETPAAFPKIKLVKPTESNQESPKEIVKPAQSSSEIVGINESISNLKNQIDLLGQELEHKRILNNLPDSLKQLHSKLEDADFDEEESKKIILELNSRLAPSEENNSETIVQELKQILQKMINLCSDFPSNQSVPIKLLFVGPSGDGKTTSLEKMAYQLVVKEKRKVGLVTLDVERIGAAPSLVSYARILGVRCSGVYDVIELGECLEKFKDLDVILFDTKGTNPWIKSELKELADWTSEIRPDRIFLVLSANHRYKDLIEMTYRFLCLGNADLLFTKLDQTKRYGGILSCAIKTKKQISFLGWGTSVTEDFEKADLSKITDMMF
ncbi:MAG: flagellar biosynthesis protein FlhF, partial [candidate division Zixibacteria bacterium]|nr:flagellar biosynthesis protein FlhF [candidate division Zixibacteria bacterium]